MASGTNPYGQDTAPGLRFELEVMAADFHEEWKRCNMVANYIAEYAAYQYPRRELAENLISTVLNEMLESSCRLVPQRSMLKLIIGEEPGFLRIEIEHGLEMALLQAYPDFLALLEGSFTDEQYLDLMTTEATTSPHFFNQLGLAMVAHDFKAALSFRPAVGSGRSSTIVRLSTKELVS